MKLDIAKLTQFNEKAEAQAVEDYTEMIKQVIECEELDDTEKEEVVGKITELIADELNHQQVLQELYVYLTDIEPNQN